MTTARRWYDEWLAHLHGDADPQSLDFDRTWGTETSRFDLGNYEPTRPRVVGQILVALDVEPERYTFVDLGSGKGRVVLLASRWPFAAVVGIEHRQVLHHIAARNLEAFTDRDGPRCPVHLLCGDAATHPLPAGPLVLFLYNPFSADVLLPILDRVGGRDAYLAYVNPRENPIVEAKGWPLVSQHLAEDPTWNWRIHRAPGS